MAKIKSASSSSSMSSKAGQNKNTSGTSSGALAKNTSGGGASNATGGNLGGGPSGDVSGVGAVGGKGVPPAASGADQIANTLQQALPTVAAGAGAAGFAIFSDLKDEYRKMIAVTRAYYAEFLIDKDYWIFNYKAHIRDHYYPLVINTPSYAGDGRGQPITIDYDLFRRGQLAGQHLAQMDIAWRTKRRIVNRYAHGEMRMDDLDISIKRYQLQVDNQVIARKIEDIYEDEFNNRRWNRLIEAANIGISGASIATQGLSSAMAGHISALQGMADYKTSLSNQIASVAGSFVHELGDN